MKASHFISLTFKSALIWSLSLNVFAAPTVEEFLKGLEQEKKRQEEFHIDAYDMSPLSRVLSREQYKDFQDSVKTEPKKTEMMEGKLITINTRDREGCQATIKAMNLGSEVCEYDAENPLVSVVIMRPMDDREYFEKKIDFSNLSEKEKIGLKSLFTLGIMGGGALGLIYSLPESVSKWDKSRGFSALAAQYGERVKAGPVIDEDDWAINYIGHPISGAYYYTMVRHQGYSAMQSAAFSFMMSTFFWEYGLEAFAEVPSIQDLILTPLIGSIIGEVFYTWASAIQENGGTLLGSKRLGKTATVLMNPAGALANKINRVFKYKFIHDAELNITNRNPMANLPSSSLHNGNVDEDKSYLGLELEFKF